jgi:hypothetical protein
MGTVGGPGGSPFSREPTFRTITTQRATREKSRKAMKRNGKGAPLVLQPGQYGKEHEEIADCGGAGDLGESVIVSNRLR